VGDLDSLVSFESNSIGHGFFTFGIVKPVDGWIFPFAFPD
jgi:hypothetical protein